MPVVTAIEKNGRRKTADVYIDGVAAFSLRLELVASTNLRVGDELPTSRRRDIEAENQRLNAHAAALRLLAIAPRSRQDLRQRLRMRHFPQTAVDAAIQRMEELGYLDDGVFARAYVEGRQAGTPKSRRALRFELSRKGISNEIVAEATEGISDDDAALEAAKRRLRSLRGLDKQSFTRKLGSFLASRGFSYSTSRVAIEQAWAELNPEALAE